MTRPIAIPHSVSPALLGVFKTARTLPPLHHPISLVHVGEALLGAPNTVLPYLAEQLDIDLAAWHSAWRTERVAEDKRPSGADRVPWQVGLTSYLQQVLYALTTAHVPLGLNESKYWHEVRMNEQVPRHTSADLLYQIVQHQAHLPIGSPSLPYPYDEKYSDWQALARKIRDLDRTACWSNLLARERDGALDAAALAPTGRRRLHPSHIRDHLDAYVIGQEEAKEALTVAVCDQAHLRQARQEQRRFGLSNLLLIGPSGSGKTWLVETLAAYLDRPLVIADCTQLTETGWLGGDIADVLTRLYVAAGKDRDRAENGIVILDEIDKVAVRPAMRTSRSNYQFHREGLQQTLLKVIEGSKVDISPEAGQSSARSWHNIQLQTNDILFIGCGAFPGLDDIVAARTQTTLDAGGFRSPPGPDQSDLPLHRRLVLAEDLCAYGFLPELVGRLPHVARLEPMSLEIMEKILVQAKDGLLEELRWQIGQYGAQLEFQPEAIKELARMGLEQPTGVRALRNILEHLFRPLKYALPDRPDIERVEISVAMLRGQEPLVPPLPAAAVPDDFTETGSQVASLSRP